MDENVSKAVKKADQYCGTYERGFAVKNTWDVIRARLVELEAENERLREWKLSYELLRREMTAERDGLQSRLAAADALLRKCRDKVNDCMHDYGVKNGGAIVREIDAHLSEPRT